jgi:hypothetical protein
MAGQQWNPDQQMRRARSQPPSAGGQQFGQQNPILNQRVSNQGIPGQNPQEMQMRDQQAQMQRGMMPKTPWGGSDPRQQMRALPPPDLPMPQKGRGMGGAWQTGDLQRGQEMNQRFDSRFAMPQAPNQMQGQPAMGWQQEFQPQEQMQGGWGQQAQPDPRAGQMRQMGQDMQRRSDMGGIPQHPWASAFQRPMQPDPRMGMMGDMRGQMGGGYDPWQEQQDMRSQMQNRMNQMQWLGRG